MDFFRRKPSSAADREVLLVLYGSTGGAYWKKKRKWGTNAHLSKWHGVTVNDQGRVVKLDLSQNNLRGPIPPEIGNLAALQQLDLDNNELSGLIPPELGNLGALTWLNLSGNQLSGRIPSELGHLSALKKLILWGNQLSGEIPPQLGNLAALRHLHLQENLLTGHIPPQLGHLGALQFLNLGSNKLDGHIPPQLGDLGALETLKLGSNNLDGPIPKELGALRRLEKLLLYSNKLTGHIPPQLGQLGALQSLELAGNELDGGPMEGESLHSWRARLRKQQPAKPDMGKEEVTVQRSSWTEGGEPTGSDADPAVGTSSPEEEDAERSLQGFTPPQEVGEGLTNKQEGEPAAEGGSVEGEDLDSWRETSREQQPAEFDVGKEGIIAHLGSSREGGEPAKSDAAPDGGTLSLEEEDAERFQVQVASFAELEKLTRENGEALEGIRRLVGKPTAGGSSPGTDFANEDKMQELDRLVAMAKTLGEMTLQHMEDKDRQRKELALPPGSKSYYIAVRTGLGNAYLAASVVASRLVRTSKTGGMGTAGETLKVLSSAVPVVGGLASFTAAALKAGDRHIQTRRLVKITEMAIDANECCLLARTLALRLTDGLTAGTIPTTCEVEKTRLPTMAGVDGGAGGCGWNQGISALPDGASEEAAMEWFTDEVANVEFNIGGRGTAAEQAGRRLGKRHLQKLLVELGRGCLRGTITVEEKVERLLKVIAPEATARPVTTPSAPERSFVQSLVPARPHDGGLDQGAKLAAMEAKLEALQLADQRRQAKLDALQSDNERLRDEGKRLQDEVAAVKKRIPKPQTGPSGGVDAGGGQLFSRRQETKTKEDFWQEAESTAGVAVADHQPVTHAQLRQFAALQDERHRDHDDRHREHDANHSRLQRELDRKKNKRGGRR